MAVEDQDDLIEEIETDEVETTEVEEIETEEEEPGEIDEPETLEEDEDDEVVVTIGEDSPPEDEEVTKAPEWVRELRKTNRELARELKELKEKEKQVIENKPIALGKKPTLEDHDYDSDAYDVALAKWYEDKIEHDKLEAKRQAEADAQAEAWNSTLESYVTAKSTLKVKDFDEAEYVVENTLNPTQQGMILQGADNPALIVYALGKNPKRAKEISEITDPVKFAFAVAKLETQMKVTNKRTAPKPESKVVGNANISGTVDSTLEKLRAEATKTGDFTKVIAYKQKLKKK